jgi:hypothetical protein
MPIKKETNKINTNIPELNIFLIESPDRLPLPEETFDLSETPNETKKMEIKKIKARTSVTEKVNFTTRNDRSSRYTPDTKHPHPRIEPYSCGLSW